MIAKRFATHDPQVHIDDTDAWPRCQVTVVCTRCDRRARAHGSDDTDPLYAALAELDQHPCALVDLDDNGFPIPVRDRA